MNKKTIFLNFCMIFVVSAAFPQKNVTFSSKKAAVIIDKKPINRAFQAFIAPIAAARPFYPLQANYYAANLGFFCKQEIKFERSTKISFKFRLGSVQQCDWLEGKRNAGILP